MVVVYVTMYTYLSVDHVGYHHDTVTTGVRKFQGQFSRFNVISQHHRLRTIRLLLNQSDFRGFRAPTSDIVPVPNINLEVNSHSDVVGNIILSNVCDVLHLVCYSRGGRE